MQIESNADYNVLAPGPVNLHPLVQQALALPMIHHRTPEFDAILKRTLAELKNIFKTTENVYILSSTGSGGMEALLVNTLSVGDTVLGIDSGKFGERWCEMAKVFGASLHTLKIEWGQSVEVAEVKQFLDKNPKTKIVFCQACETSTGALHPIQELGELIHNYPETLFLVDGITALGAVQLPMDAWHIDGLVGGSQKAFMLPTGLCFISFSKKAWARVQTANCPRFYFDARKEAGANSKGETFFSSNVSLIRALDVVLKLIKEKSFEKHLSEIAARADFSRQFILDLGLCVYALHPSNSLTAAAVPKGFDSQEIRSLLEKKYRITLMGGQDQAKGKILRIGHMGNISWDQMQELFLSLRKTMQELNPQFHFPTSEDELRVKMQDWIRSHVP